ncbi:UPF0755 protein [Elusimicrobium posterum]|uniref:endolytic transglycosylase MltG n=1 Tax=Elusimicrobium posterum TaxID=3116653 RepID=UPI003C767CC5
MKKYKKLILLVLSIIVFALLCCAVKSYYFSKGEQVVFEIKEGQSGSLVAKNLKQQGIIKSEFMFKLVLKLFANPKSLKAGRFDLRLNTSAEEVINCIASGKCQHLERITIIEGWRTEEIAELLEQKGICSAQAFTALAKEKDLEGYLYPSTYVFSQNTPPQKVIDKMTEEFDKRVRPLFKIANMHGLSERAILALASIVEREAVVHDERPKIAAVYLNRIRIGKRLEADPTTQYAVGYFAPEGRWWKKGLTLTDLRMDNPYNTYRYGGIPPGPICNPSAASVAAVLNPEPDFTQYYYFVAENDEGRHVFSKSYDEHVKNIRRIRALRGKII